jgi:hypothetical protein
MRLKINYQNIPVLAIGFTRSSDIIGCAIRLFRGSTPLTDRDKRFPNHSFIVTEDHGQFFATEETLGGLRENSLEKYTSPGNRITAFYTWNGFNDPVKREAALQCLAEVRRRATDDGKYDILGLLSFVPLLKLFFKPDPKKQWCSENVASVLKTFGCECIASTTIAPDQLEKLMADRKDQFAERIGYYIQ